MKLRYVSLFSGIEAASVAWEPLGWEPLAFAENEKFPCAVLATRYPRVPNLGDVTAPDFVDRVWAIGQPDIVIGGSPCQSFSVAGLREGLTDTRGNLALRFVEICNALDPRIVLWENVPGVLSDRTNAFGCLIAGLAGLDDAPVPVTSRWPRAGRVDGQRRRVAWAVLDAQFFGVPQRRRRVFLLATPRVVGGDPAAAGIDPAQVLFVGQGLRRNPPARGEAGQGSARGTAPGLGASGRGFARVGDPKGQDPVVVAPLSAREKGGGGLGTDMDLGGGLLAFGGNRTSGPPEVATACRAKGGTGHGDFESETFITGARVVGTLSSAGGKAAGSATQQDAESGLLVAHSLSTQDEDAACRRFLDAINDGREPDPRDTKVNNDYWARQNQEGDRLIGAPLPFDPKQIAHPANHSSPKAGDPCHPLRAVANCEPANDYGADAGFLSPTLRAAGHDASHANAGAPPAVAFQFIATPMPFDTTQITSKTNRSRPKPGDPCHPLAASADSPAIAWKESQNGVRTGDVHPTIDAHKGSRRQGGVVVADPITTTEWKMYTHEGSKNFRLRNVVAGVRRLTVTECERLQGFPDGWVRDLSEADGSCYKVLGNSMAVPVIHWLGWRIAMFLKAARRKLPLEQSAGQCGSRLELEKGQLNEKERAVLACFARAGSTRTLAQLAATFAPDPRGNSWARNALRRLIRGGFLERVAAGTYRRTSKT